MHTGGTMLIIKKLNWDKYTQNLKNMFIEHDDKEKHQKFKKNKCHVRTRGTVWFLTMVTTT